MALRPIAPEERALIEHLLKQVTNGGKYRIPDEVEPYSGSGPGSILLARRGEHAGDLVEAEYRDKDRQPVLITLSVNEFGELYDLDLWRSDFDPLQQYPRPEDLFGAQ
ncbi:DUF6984 family protein [Flaviaesturariibacter amylovorans]|uniref:DUF6984 domain-containing protein n=1 Tax=Flaviaesturariibacter amylovorans TaxID=1084520 RepID=A0ABP8H3S0_9BACT